MQSVMNLSYKSSKSINHPKPANFDVMCERSAIGQSIYHNRLDLRDQITTHLVPHKKQLFEKIKCDCGPIKVSKRVERNKQNKSEFNQRCKLD